MGKAQNLLNWWNCDYFNEKGCHVYLKFQNIKNQLGYEEAKPYLILNSFK